MIATPFLTQIDSRAAVRGSRDPLSLVPVWASFGRTVVGNLTTASTSLRGFTTLLLGYYMVERVLEKNADEAPLHVFLRVEQLAAYCRVFVRSKDTAFRGTERVVKRLQDSSRITLSAEPGHQILGDQKTYGLWGLYSVAARTSGLLLPDRPALTPEASSFVEEAYLSRLTRAGLRGVDALLQVVAPDRKELDLGRGAGGLADVVASIHSARVSAREREIYQEYLVDGGREQNTGGLQRTLSAFLDRVETDEFRMEDLDRVIRLASKAGEDDLANRLISIARLESVIVPAANLFGFLLRCNDRSLEAVSRDVRRTWGSGLGSLRGDAADAVKADIARIARAEDSAHALGSFANLSASGDWAEAIRELARLNEWVMARRGSSGPWLRVEKGSIRVDYRDEGTDLLPAADLAKPWQNTYFINSLHGIKQELEAD